MEEGKRGRSDSDDTLFCDVEMKSGSWLGKNIFIENWEILRMKLIEGRNINVLEDFLIFILVQE